MSSRWDIARTNAWAEYGKRHSRGIIAAEWARATWPVWGAALVIGGALWVTREYDPPGILVWFWDHWPVSVILILAGVVLWRMYMNRPL